MSRHAIPATAPAGTLPTAGSRSLFRLPPPPLRVPVAQPTAGTSLAVDICGLMQAGDHAPAWRDLALRALERNVFYEPDFALAVTRHMRDFARPVFVMVRDPRRSGDDGLLGLFPVVMPKGSIGTLDLFGWRHEQLALGTPLVDRDHAAPVVAAFLDWIARQSSRAGGVLLPFITEDGPTAGVIRMVAEETGRAIRRFGEHQRAVLRAGGTLDETLGRAMPGKKVKELRRLRRRLEEKGAVEVTRCTDGRTVRDATELFLALEAKGWKGRNGTAFLDNSNAATFLRTVTRSLAQQGECSVDVMTVGGAPAGVGIILGDTTRSFYWKTAFDEELASYSPGVQLTLEMSSRQLEGGIAETDSCAIADHPMIDRLWPDRLAVADWFVEARAASTSAAIAVAGESARRSLRSTAKNLYHLAKGRKP
jgi:CelD/BcsL family acetyltransferase involved in cellulose biosynthesis